MMKKQAWNPYMDGREYVPDGEPHIVGDRVYVYGSHDLFNGLTFCLGDYVCWSAPVDDLGNWRYEGVIFRREQDPSARGVRIWNGMAAPDMAQGPDGRFYLYYFIGGTGKISVAVSDRPEGPYAFYGDVHYADGTPIGKKGEPMMFDPGILMDRNGRLHLYVGFGLRSNPFLLRGSHPTLHGPMHFELNPSDMLTVCEGPSYIGVEGVHAKDSSYAGHPFMEASSMRCFGDTYYFIYSSLNSHELCYAKSSRPDGGFVYGGVLISNGDIGLPGITDTRHAHNCTGNTHGSLIRIGEKYYVFYHRHTNRKQSSRQACAEEIRFENGQFLQAEMTSCRLNGGPLAGKGWYPSYIACNLYGKNGTRFLSMLKMPEGTTPYLTQSGGDSLQGPDPFVANFCEGCTVGFKYFDLRYTKTITVVLKGRGSGVFVTVRTRENGPVLFRIPVRDADQKTEFKGEFPEHWENGENVPLYFGLERSAPGKKAKFAFYGFFLG